MSATETAVSDADLVAELEAYVFAWREFGHRDLYPGQIAELEAMKLPYLTIAEKIRFAEIQADKSRISEAAKRCEATSADLLRARELLPAALEAYQKAADNYQKLLNSADVAKDDDRRAGETLERLKNRAAEPKPPLRAPELVDLDIDYYAREVLAARERARNAPHEYTSLGVTIGDEVVTNDTAGAALARIYRENKNDVEKKVAISKALRGEKPDWRP